VKLILVFMRKFGHETHLSFHVAGEEVWDKKHIGVFMRKFGFAAHLSFHVVGEEVGARNTSKVS